MSRSRPKRKALASGKPLRSGILQAPLQVPAGIPFDSGSPSWSRSTAGILDAALEILRGEYGSGTGLFDGAVGIDDLKVQADRKELVVDAGIGLVPAAAIADRTLYFVGDLHGDLASLESVIEKTGFLGSDRTVLCFLGDYGDRGPATIPVLLNLLLLKLRDPGRVFLLRGNHEHLRPVDETGATVAPDSKEVAQWRQGTTDEGYITGLERILAPLFPNPGFERWHAHRLVAEIFDLLPVALLFPDGLMAVHGGVVPRFPSAHPLKGAIAPDFEESLRVEALSDLRKPDVQRFMLWSRCEYKDEVYCVWNGDSANEVFDFGDLAAFFEITGIKRMVRGHDHPEAARVDAESLLTLCTTTSLDSGDWRCRPHIARYQAGRLPEPILLSGITPFSPDR